MRTRLLGRQGPGAFLENLEEEEVVVCLEITRQLLVPREAVRFSVRSLPPLLDPRRREVELVRVNRSLHRQHRSRAASSEV